MMKKTVYSKNASLLRDHYTAPFIRCINVTVSGVVCNSYSSNSVQDYNLRSDIDIEWD